MNTNNMTYNYPFLQLLAYEEFVLMHEESFMEKFFNDSALELHEICFSFENVRVVMIDCSYQHMSASIDIIEFLVWVGLIEMEKK